MAGATLSFTLVGRDASASRALRKVGSDSETTHRKLGKLGGIGKKAGLAIAGGVGMAAGALAVAVPVLAEWTKNAAEDERGQRRLAIALKNTAGATKTSIAGVEDWISKVGVATGVTDDEMRPALQRLVQSTHDVGKAQDLLKISMDASAGTGKSLEAVTTAVAKAQNGNLGALSRLGIKIKDTDGKALSFNAVMAQMAQTFKGQVSKQAESFDGRMARLKLVIDETKESVGSKFLPVLTNLSGWALNKGLPALGKLGGQIMPKLKSMFDSVRKTIDENRPGLEKLGRILGVVGGFIITKVVPAFIKWEGIVAKGVIVALSTLGKVLPPIVSAFLRGAASIVGGFRGLYVAVTGVLSGILTVAARTLGWIPGIGPKIKGAQEAFRQFRDATVTRLGQVEGGLRSAAAKVDDFSRKAKDIPEAKIKADIADLTGKLATAKGKLRDPDLTKERRASIKATIAQLEREVVRAKLKLAGVKGKTVTIRANVVYREIGKPNAVKNGNGKVIDDGRAFGGFVPGSGRLADSRWAPVSGGEFVSTAATVSRLGRRYFEALNAGMSPNVGYMAGGGGGVNLTVNVNGGFASKDEIARTTVGAILEVERQTGRYLLPRSG